MKDTKGKSIASEPLKSGLTKKGGDMMTDNKWEPTEKAQRMKKGTDRI